MLCYDFINMSTELILTSIALFELTFLTMIYRIKSNFIAAPIIINLILISIFGSQIISVFGFKTNVGNVFYGALTFFVYFLIEHYGPKTANKAIWISFSFLAFFMIISQMTIGIYGVPETKLAEEALHTVFSITPRIALASLLAFLISQTININAYQLLKKATKDRALWLRVNASNILTQLIDSGIFFVIAFITTAPSNVLELMITGFLIKVAVGLLSTVFLYLSYISNHPHQEKSV